MTEQAQSNDNTFVGIMIMKDGKWAPHSKYDEKTLGSALLKAKELDKDSDIEGVKVMKISASKSIEDKEIWVSPRSLARSKAESASKLREGENQTRQHLAEVYAARKTGVRVK